MDWFMCNVCYVSAGARETRKVPSHLDRNGGDA
jgi:hypothetical protein